ncbi:hypothetical protein TNIN_492261 [Trichonephila inaurata madagascariensis]|uniref:Uncharacterized protein n=1 Tax=Trichonephila inaurata madagascariensis TaxID=2747483 RepID=A0A8X6MJ51_9ARAC|nr:hypothetical protein TNIN_492261 [Trichonephila inaurata madagascariensis]
MLYSVTRGTKFVERCERDNISVMILIANKLTRRDDTVDKATDENLRKLFSRVNPCSVPSQARIINSLHHPLLPSSPSPIQSDIELVVLMRGFANPNCKTNAGGKDL